MIISANRVTAVPRHFLVISQEIAYSTQRQQQKWFANAIVFPACLILPIRCMPSLASGIVPEGGMIFRALAKIFENWIKPYPIGADLRPPRLLWAFVWHYVRQAKLVFVLMLILGGVVAVLEATLFWFVGRLVDMLDTIPKGSGWNGLIAAHGTELFLMAFTVLIVRFFATTLSALVEEQTVVPGFFTLVRWQHYVHIARQSMSFFQNDFSGRIVTKVWGAGQATGDLVISLLQVAWFMIIYVISTMTLVSALDWRLAVTVGIWVFCSQSAQGIAAVGGSGIHAERTDGRFLFQHPDPEAFWPRGGK
jgi:hypothetical protein